VGLINLINPADTTAIFIIGYNLILHFRPLSDYSRTYVHMGTAGGAHTRLLYLPHPPSKNELHPFVNTATVAVVFYFNQCET